MTIPGWQLARVAQVLSSGGVIAYPTESVYGLGCDPANQSALHRLLDLKQRSTDKGLIILVSDMGQAMPFIEPLSEEEFNQLSQPRERATTWLVNKKPGLPALLTGSYPKIALRITCHPIARAICQITDKALVSTSCNLSGQAEMTLASQVKEAFGDRLDYVVRGDCGGQAPSQIIDLQTGQVHRG